MEEARKALSSFNSFDLPPIDPLDEEDWAPVTGFKGKSLLERAFAEQTRPRTALNISGNRK